MPLLFVFFTYVSLYILSSFMHSAILMLFSRFYFVVFYFYLFSCVVIDANCRFLYQYSLRFTIRVKKEDAICEKQHPLYTLFLIHVFNPIFFRTDSVAFFKFSIKIACIVVSNCFYNIRHRNPAVYQKIHCLLHPLFLKKFFICFP